MAGRKCGFVPLALGILTIIVGASKAYDEWFAGYMEFRFFNIKNNLHTQATGESTDIPIELGGIPIVEEKGPYVYRETRVWSDFTYNDNQTEVSYSEKKRFEFDRKASVGGEDDIIFGLNMPLISVYDTLAKADLSGVPGGPLMAEMLFNGMARIEKLEVIQKQTVSDWLWGSNSKILEVLHRMKYMLPKDMQEKLPPVKFGYMDDNLATNHWVIGTGEEDPKDRLQIKKYNGKSELDFWGSRYSNMINGTDGLQFHNNVHPEETLYMFSPDLCRSIYLTNKGKEVIDGIETLVFTSPSDVFADPKQNPNNEGFCEPEPCLGSGLLRVSNCRHGAPVVASLPHLCEAEEDRVNSIKGISCDPNLHKTRFYVEPESGFVLKVQKRLEFNAIIEPWEKMDLTKKMKRGQILPLFWVQEGFLGL